MSTLLVTWQGYGVTLTTGYPGYHLCKRNWDRSYRQGHPSTRVSLLPSKARTLEWQNTWWGRENVQRRLEMSLQPVWILHNRTWHQKVSSTKLSCIQILCHNLVWVNIWCAVVNVYSFQGAVLKGMDKQHNYQIIPFWRLVHCRQLLDCLKNNLPWNLSLRTPLLQAHLNSRDENWVAEKCLHNPCICYLY